ncbi:mycofactocin biosynthesis chaperone MftB [Streptomyces sp. NPDC003393]
MSTDTAVGSLDFEAAWRIHPKVSIRPEHFGALLYHFGTRRLSFLKSPTLLAVLQALSSRPSARAACLHVGVPSEELPRYRAALAQLAASDMICERSGP